MSNLPAEILLEIFSLLEQSQNRNSLCECVVVCKKWNQTSRHALYSKVEIKTKIKLKRFVRSIKHNERLAELVKELILDCSTSNGDPYQDTTFTDLCNHLSNLEKFATGYKINYLTLLDALSNSKLLSLKYIDLLPLDEDDFDNYAKCALFIKNRLENLVIADRGTNCSWIDRGWMRNGDQKREAYFFQMGKANFDRLYSKLHQFPRLKELDVTAEAEDPSRILKSVTSICPNLHTLHFDINLDDDSHRKKYDYIVATECTPMVNMKTLNGREVNYHEPEFLPYAMDTYPQLQDLMLRTTHSRISTFIQKETAKRFFDCLLRIDKVDVLGLLLKVDDLLDVTHSFFEDPTLPSSKHLRIKYSSSSRDTAKLNFVKGDFDVNRIYTLIEYPVPRGEVLEHTRIFEEHGKLLRSLIFGKDRTHYSIHIPDVLMGKFIDHALCHCPNLETLHIRSYNLDKIGFSSFCLSNRKSNFRALGMSDSLINESVFQELSTVFESIDRLDLINNQYYYDDSEITYRHSTIIDMIETKIGMLQFSFTQDPIIRNTYIKLYTASSNKTRYFKYEYDFKTNTNRPLKRCVEGDYQENRDFLIDIRCRSLRRLESLDDTRAFITFFDR